MRPAQNHKLAAAIEAHLVAGRREFRHEVRLHEITVAAKLLKAFSRGSYSRTNLSSRAITSPSSPRQRQIFGGEGLFAIKS